jgi:4a-hydroxytetrahydrobiopterin dehydratase
MDLFSKKCVPCEAGVQPMSREESERYLLETPGWSLAEGGQSIQREFRLKDFKEAMRFVNVVADIAESEGHHPDISISWNKVKLELTTHAIKGLSENDFILAAKINAAGDWNV